MIWLIIAAMPVLAIPLIADQSDEGKLILLLGAAAWLLLVVASLFEIFAS
jgi:hypothetical protein